MQFVARRLVFILWLKFHRCLFPKFSIDNKSALVQVMAWHHAGDKPLPEPMMTGFYEATWCDATSRHLATMSCNIKIQGLYSLSGKTSYHKISWSLEAARFGSKLFQSLWNLAGTSAALLPRCLSNFRAMLLQHPISRLRDFTRFGGKTSYRLVNRGPGGCLNMNILSYQYRISHYKDKMVAQPSYLHNRNPHTWKDGLYIETGPCYLEKSR